MTDRPTPPSRRVFARRAVAEALSFVEEVVGRPQRKLSDLADLPRERLGLLKGAVRRDIELTVTDAGLSVVTRSADGACASRWVMACTAENTGVFNRLTGDLTLDEVAAEITADLGWPDERAWDHTKSLFFELVERGVCLPANVVD
jgi:hypothetical protein